METNCYKEKTMPVTKGRMLAFFVSLKTTAPAHFEHFFTHSDLFVRFSSSKWGLNDPPAPASIENNILTNGCQFAHIFIVLRTKNNCRIFHSHSLLFRFNRS